MFHSAILLLDAESVSAVKVLREGTPLREVWLHGPAWFGIGKLGSCKAAPGSCRCRRFDQCQRLKLSLAAHSRARHLPRLLSTHTTHFNILNSPRFFRRARSDDIEQVGGCTTP